MFMHVLSQSKILSGCVVRNVSYYYSVYGILIFVNFCTNCITSHNLWQIRSSKSVVKIGSNFPDLSKHNNHMARCLTRDMYEKLSKKTTPGGVTLDQCIQTGTFNSYLFLLDVCE